MPRITFPREFYIPAGAMKVADKHSDAVAYLSTNRAGRPRATVFFGKQAKPIGDFNFKDEARREKYVTFQFEARRERQKRTAARHAERKAWVPTYKVGDIFRTCWGYDQTNVEFFEIVSMTGKFCVVREIAQEVEATGSMQGRCGPVPGEFVGKPMRRMMQQRGIKIDQVRTAWLMTPKEVAGVRVYDSASFSTYA